MRNWVLRLDGSEDPAMCSKSPLEKDPLAYQHATACSHGGMEKLAANNIEDEEDDERNANGTTIDNNDDDDDEVKAEAETMEDKFMARRSEPQRTIPHEEPAAPTPTPTPTPLPTPTPTPAPAAARAPPHNLAHYPVDHSPSSSRSTKPRKTTTSTSPHQRRAAAAAAAVHNHRSRHSDAQSKAAASSTASSSAKALPRPKAMPPSPPPSSRPRVQRKSTGATPQHRLNGYVLHSVTPRACVFDYSSVTSPGSYTDYDLVLENVRSGHVWRVARRFSTFAYFRKEMNALLATTHSCACCRVLRVQLADLHATQFPHRRLWGSNKPGVVWTRAARFHQYVDGLLRLGALAQSRRMQSCRAVATRFAHHVRGFLVTESVRFTGIPGPSGCGARDGHHGGRCGGGRGRGHRATDAGHVVDAASVPCLLPELSGRSRGGLAVIFEDEDDQLLVEMSARSAVLSVLDDSDDEQEQCVDKEEEEEGKDMDRGGSDEFGSSDSTEDSVEDDQQDQELVHT